VDSAAEETYQADEDEIDGDDVIQQAGHYEDEDARDESCDGADAEKEVHEIRLDAGLELDDKGSLTAPL
jgi:hypothetical protein